MEYSKYNVMTYFLPQFKNSVLNSLRQIFSYLMRKGI